MAGPDPRGRFRTAHVREKLQFAISIGTPQVEAERPTFYFAAPEVTGPGDDNGRPWNFDDAEPVEPAPDPVQVECSIETREGESDETSFGAFDAQELILGFFEEEWAAIDGWTRVEIAGKRYKRSYPLPPATLFDLTFRRVRVEANDV